MTGIKARIKGRPRSSKAAREGRCAHAKTMVFTTPKLKNIKSSTPSATKTSEPAGKKRSNSQIALTHRHPHQKVFHRRRLSQVLPPNILSSFPNTLAARANFRYPAPFLDTGIR